MNDNMEEMFENLDGLLAQTDLKDVTAEGAGFEELPEGYYLCEVEKAELKVSKSSKMPMVAFQFKVVDDGVTIKNENEDWTPIKGSKNRKIFMYYVLKDETSVKRFATDMLKFEGDTAGESLLEKECFMNSSLLCDALEILESGYRIYIQISVSENQDGTSSTWKNLVSWKRAANLELK